MKENFGVPMMPANDNEVVVNNVERLSDWRELKAAAPEQAETIFSEGIPNFEQLRADEQIIHLQNLINSLPENNENRFIAYELGKKLGRLIVIQESQRRLAQFAA